jgi:hypothetical protein
VVDGGEPTDQPRTFLPDLLEPFDAATSAWRQDVDGHYLRLSR